MDKVVLENRMVVAKALEVLPHERFNMGTFHCGTIACIAGHAILTLDPEWFNDEENKSEHNNQWFKGQDHAAYLLGLSSIDAVWLFHSWKLTKDEAVEVLKSLAGGSSMERALKPHYERRCIENKRTTKREENMTEIEVEVIMSTANAVLVTDDDEREVWLPLSQIEFISGDPHRKGKARIELPEWLAKEKELI